MCRRAYDLAPLANIRQTEDTDLLMFTGQGLVSALMMGVLARVLWASSSSFSAVDVPGVDHLWQFWAHVLSKQVNNELCF